MSRNRKSYHSEQEVLDDMDAVETFAEKQIQRADDLEKQWSSSKSAVRRYHMDEAAAIRKKAFLYRQKRMTRLRDKLGEVRTIPMPFIEDASTDS